MAEAAETLDRDGGALGDVLLADAVEDGYAGAEEGGVFCGGDVGGDLDEGFGADEAVFGVWGRDSSC